MEDDAFRLGVNEVRGGVPPTFDRIWGDDTTNAAWNYERGRQWALLAPRSMPLYVDGRLNPKAVALYSRAGARGWLT